MTDGCEACDKRLAPRRTPKGRYSAHIPGHHLLRVFRHGREVLGVLAVQVPDRAWRLRLSPTGQALLCERCGKGIAMYVDTHGPFEVKPA